jgi:methylglutaconyl-CoA hydratase
VEVMVDRGDDRNLLTMEMCRRLIDVLTTPPEGAHVLRLRTAGEVFCLGRERSADETTELRTEATTLARLNDALRSSELVTIMEVSGHAAGFGAGLAANADIAVASDDTEIWFPEVRIDLAPAVVLSWLPGVVGRKEALWLTSSGERISAGRAAELGLLTRVVPRAALGTTVDAMIATLRGFNPRVHREIKDFLRTSQDMAPSSIVALAVERLIIGSMSRRKDGEHGR